MYENATMSRSKTVVIDVFIGKTGHVGKSRLEPRRIPAGTFDAQVSGTQIDQ